MAALLVLGSDAGPAAGFPGYALAVSVAALVVAVGAWRVQRRAEWA